MSESSVIRHRVVFAWGDQLGPFLVEFYVRSANGGSWEVFVGRGAANAEAKCIEDQERSEQDAFEHAPILAARADPEEAPGLVPKVFEIAGMVYPDRPVKHFFAVTTRGDVAMASLGRFQEASEIRRALEFARSQASVSQAEVPKRSA